MSLILLFIGFPQQSTGPTPSVLYAIETTRPTMMLVQNVTGNFTTSEITYSSATDTYNSGVYGGSELTKPVLITLNSIDQARPVTYSIDKF